MSGGMAGPGRPPVVLDEAWRARVRPGHARLAATLLASGILHLAAVGLILGVAGGGDAAEAPAILVLTEALPSDSPALEPGADPDAGPPPIAEDAGAPAATSAAADDPERAALEQRLDALSADNARLAGEVQRQQEAIAAREAEAAALRQAREWLGEAVGALEAERDALAARVQDGDRQVAALEEALREQADRAERARAEAQTAYEALVAALRDEIASRDVALRQAREGVTVSIEDRVLFPSGQATLTGEGEAVIARVGAVLARAPGQDVLVEGHTDNVPIGPHLRSVFPSNWELSAARASAVVRHLVDHGGIAPARLHAVGRADTEPAADNDTEAGRRVNRRIEIILRPAAGESP